MKQLFFFILILPASIRAQPANEEVSATLLFNGEPFLAVSPLDSRDIAVAWMSYSALTKEIGIRTRASSDGGATWSNPVDMPHAEAGWGSADVSMAWRKDGRLFLCYIDYLSDSDTSGGVFVASSSDGGMSWSTPVMAINGEENNYISLDRPWIAVDDSIGQSGGNLYIPTKPASWHPLPNHTFFTRSTDDGATWSEESVLDSVPFPAMSIKAPMGSPAVANDGTLYIAYPFFAIDQGVHGGYALAKSTDGGASFSRSFIVQPTPVGDTLSKGGFRLIADPTNAKHLAFFWLDARDGDNDIFASATFDGGGSWSAPVRVNDDPIGNGVLQDMVWPAFGADGTIAAVWRDRRNGTGTGYASATDTYYAYSTDGGNTFSKNFRMSDLTAPYETILDAAGNDFMSSALVNDTLYASWADTRTSTALIPQLEIYFAKVPIGQTNWVQLTNLSGSNTNLCIYPNPAAGNSTITFNLEKSSHCNLSLYDESGAHIRTILDAIETPGEHSIPLDRKVLAPGDYLIVLDASSERDVVKLTIAR